MMSRLRMLTLLGLLTYVPVAGAQLAGPPIPVDLPSSFTVQYRETQPTQCYRVPRPQNGGITATLSGRGVWDVCIGDQQCPSDCSRTGRRSATAVANTRGNYYFVRVISGSPGMAATLTLNRSEAAATANVSGTWTVVFKGQTRTTMTLEQSGTQVTGNLVTTDGTQGYVIGTVAGSTLTLQRNTGMNTIQHYQVTVAGDSFSGTYRNQGRVADSGAFTGTRDSSVSGTWIVVFKGQTRTTLTLEQTGNQVTGNLITTDGTPGYVTGTLAGSTLTLQRNTGMNTIQHYQVTVQGDAFSGNYRNQGRVADSGAFTGSRSTGGSGPGNQPGRGRPGWINTVSGMWTVVFKGQTSTTMTLEQSGDQVTGNLATTDGTQGYVSGIFDGSTLTLQRNTGMNTVQHYQVAVQGDSFSGTFRNEGRIADNGTFTGSRSAGTGAFGGPMGRGRQAWGVNVTGTWTVVFRGQTRTTMTLEQSGDLITGNMITTDGTPGYVSGSLNGSILTLSRNTGLNTIQNYQVTVQGDSFSGTYRNQGRIADSGNFTGSRVAGISGTWTVVFKGQTRTTMTLEQIGDRVTGNLVTTDGTAGYVTGQFINSTLTLARDTGLETIQYYQVTVQGDSFSGVFRNEGRHADNGTFTGSRR